MTGPHEPEQHDEPEDARDAGATPSDAGSVPVDPPTEPGWRAADGAPGAGPASSADGSPPRRVGWRSRGVRLGVAGVLAALVLLGGGFGIGYAVADTAHPAATHAAAGKAHARKGGAGAGRQHRAERGCTTPPAAGTSGRPGSSTPA